jgi:hypothetical protein
MQAQTLSEYNPERRLAAAVLWRAVRDARRGSADAAHFLAQEAEGWGAIVGLDIEWPVKSAHCGAKP